MKKGIALLITIGFITILTALMSYMFSITNHIFKSIENIESRNQDFIIYKDVKTILDERAKDLTSSEGLSTFLLGIPSIYDKKTGLKLSVEVQSLSNKLNINSILIKNKQDDSVLSFLHNVYEQYNVLDATFFTNLILDTIDEDSLSRGVMSEINEEDVKFSNGRIVSKEHFKALLDYYVDKSGDSNILDVPWEKLIYFGSLSKNTIDCDRINEELSLILFKNEESFTGCAGITSTKDKELAKQYNLQAFNANNSYYVLTTIEHELDNKTNKVSFMYETKTQEASSVDFIY